MKMSSSFLLFLILFLIVSDCKKAEEEIPPQYPCEIPMSVRAWMNISGEYPGNGDFIADTTPTLKWIHQPLDQLYSYGRKYDVYLGTLPESMTKIQTDQIIDTFTLNGLIPDQRYFWKIVAKYDWFDNNGAHCSNVTETKKMSFTPYKKTDRPYVFTLPVYVHDNIPPRTGGRVADEGSTPLIERGVYFGKSSSPELNGTKFQIGNGTGLFSLLLSGLDPLTTYYIKAFASNSNGTGLGSEITFTTGQNSTYESVRDTDGNSYYTVSIGNHVWMAENLKTTRFNDGTPIPHLSASDNSFGYTWYNNDENLSALYGFLYSESTVNSSGNGKKNMCPVGWHVPSDQDWNRLITFLEGEAAAGGKLKEIGDFYWEYPNNTNSTKNDFSALPAGEGILVLGSLQYQYLGEKSNWWSSTSENVNETFYFSVSNDEERIYKRSGNVSNYFSVRCIKD